MSSDETYGNCGAFIIPSPIDSKKLFIICSDQEGWEHVSVSREDRIPYWPEMDFIKYLFWGTEDTVIQYHPPKSQYVNNCPTCLHLWRKIGYEFPLPPIGLVGVQ